MAYLHDRLEPYILRKIGLGLASLKCSLGPESDHLIQIVPLLLYPQGNVDQIPTGPCGDDDRAILILSQPLLESRADRSSASL
jgi:hypothetical protein